jgi:hypothetical protein
MIILLLRRGIEQVVVRGADMQDGSIYSPAYNDDDYDDMTCYESIYAMIE